MASTFPILLIDDDTSLLTTLQQVADTSFPEAMFSQLSRVDEAKKYISSLDGSLPKLVLLDIDFKEPLTGFDVLNHLRTTPKSAMLPVIILTASQSASDVAASYNRGASSFTIKPLSVTEWKEYLRVLRLYWLQTVTLPPGK